MNTDYVEYNDGDALLEGFVAWQETGVQRPLVLARSGAEVLGVVSVHGIFAPGDVANESIQSRVLCLHGHDDPMVPPEQVLAFETEMTAANVDWQMHVYGGTTHAFTNPAANNPGFGTVFNPVAERRAWKTLADFLAESFQE